MTTTELENEIGRWQQSIYEQLCKTCPDAIIDGAGSDSCDPLDFTQAEIGQALAHLKNKMDECQKILGYDDGDLLDNVTRYRAYATNEIEVLRAGGKKLAAYAQDLQIKSPRIYTRCPACLNDTLTIGEDRHLVCTWQTCPDPTLIDRAGKLPKVNEDKFTRESDRPI